MSTDTTRTSEGSVLSKHPPPNVTTRVSDNISGAPPLNNTQTEEKYNPEMTMEPTIWDVYNNEARKVDAELVKEWKESLNFLLVSMSVLAAVLTAFLIETKTLLEADPTELLVQIAVFHVNNGGNSSNLHFEPPEFVPSSVAITVNCCLFASLGTSLLAVLTSVIALQWVSKYNAELIQDGLTPEDRAMRRQFRFAGATAWKMDKIIAALPLLLYSAVAYFWLGAILWIWETNVTVGYIVTGGAVMALLVYLSATLIGAAFVSAPFHTPHSQGIDWLFKPIVSSLVQLTNFISRNFTPQSIVEPLQRAATLLRLLRGHLRRCIHHLRLKRIVGAMRKYIVPQDKATRRENLAAIGHPKLKEQALSWLANQLPISVNERIRTEMLIRELLNHSIAQPIPPKFPDAPWPALLGTLAWCHLRKIVTGTLLKKDYNGLSALLRCIKLPAMWSIISRTVRYQQDPRISGYWDQYRFNKDTFLSKPIEDAPKSALTLVRDVPIPSNGGTHEIEATIKLIKWRNLKDINDTYVWKEVFNNNGQFSPQYRKACLDSYRQVVGCWESVTYDQKGTPEDQDVIFSNLIQSSHSRALTSQEVFALVQAFEAWVTKTSTGFPEKLSPENIIRRPLLYGLHLSDRPEWKETHREITISVARAVEGIPKEAQEPWVWSIIMMVWLGYSGIDWDQLIREHGENIGMRGLWPSVATSWSWKAPSIPHLMGIVRVVGRLLQNEQETGPLWLFGDEERKHYKMVQAIEVFDSLVIQDRRTDLHLALVRLLLIELPHLDCLRSPAYQVDQVEWLSRVNDPCLAILGTYVCKALSPVKIEVTEGYINEHTAAIGVIKDVLYQQLDFGDPEAIWHFRARFWSVGSASSTQKLITSAMHNPKQLSSLQLIFQYPLSCRNHCDGPHHILLHLFEASSPSIRMPEGTMVLGNIHLGREALNPILALLTLPTGWTPPVNFENGFNRECINRIKRIVDDIKQEPAHVFALLTDIVSAYVDIVSRPKQAACVLDLVRRVSSVFLDEAPIITLHRMDRALKKLILEMLQRRRGTIEDREIMVDEMKRLCSLLQRKASERCISSSCHLRIVSCARASTPMPMPPDSRWSGMHDMA